jgi:uncharacterized protein YutE (UPF0331/DUF86 family)
VVDRVVLAGKLAAIRDAVARIREVVPRSADDLLADRTAREVVTFNLFLALQESISLATHWLADEGWEVPQTHGAAFTALAARQVIDQSLAERLRSAAGLRNLIAHQYGVMDFRRVFAIASEDLDDLLSFCQQLAQRAGPPPDRER